MLLFQEFDLDIKDKSGAKNLMADHLSKREMDEDPTPIHDDFLDEQQLQLHEWVEAITTRNNDSKVVASFIRSNIFCKFGIPRAMIRDQGLHFCNRTIDALLRKYGVAHKVSIPYHPKTNGQAEEVESCNLEMEKACLETKLQLQQLEELRFEAYENSRIYKEKTK
uniref:Uncharacterized protein LOC105853052 n=1 Tax=Cicer arietinum TaxID=3827 RepID=A0A1S3EI73_CICAR|nr:uncharacterized protein LOC105853052 [Cicer arietinum]